MKLRGFTFVVFTPYTVVYTSCELDCVIATIFFFTSLKGTFTLHTPEATENRELTIELFVVFTTKEKRVDGQKAKQLRIVIKFK